MGTEQNRTEQNRTEQVILLVDDERDLRGVICDILEAPGRKFIQTGNGEEAIYAVTKTLPHLIISDFQMPKIDGLMLLNKLWKHGFRIPSIMITGNTLARPDLRQQAVLNGAIGFLEKPLDFVRLKCLTEKGVAVGMRLADLDKQIEKLAFEMGIPYSDRDRFKAERKALMTNEILMEAMRGIEDGK